MGLLTVGDGWFSLGLEKLMDGEVDALFVVIISPSSAVLLKLASWFAILFPRNSAWVDRDPILIKFSSS